MQNFLTVLFFVLGNAAMLWAVLELRDRTKVRHQLRELADERAAEEGLRRMSTTYIHAELAEGHDIPRQPE